METRKARKTRPSQDARDPDTAELAGARRWKELLLDQLMDLPSDAFERLAQRLLREPTSTASTARVATVASMDLAFTGSGWSASRSSSSASAIGAA